MEEAELEAVLRTLVSITANLNDLLSRLHAKGSGARHTLEGRKILAIDDDPGRIFALGSLLDDGGARLLWAEDVRGGVALLDRHPDVDLVVVHVPARETDVREVTRKIRATPRRPTLPIIAVTEPADDVRLVTMIQQCMEHRAREGVAAG